MILVSRLRDAWRNCLRFPPLTPAVGGLLLVVVATTAQSYASYIRWLEYEKRGKWQAEAAVDFGICGRHQTSFLPIVSREHKVAFALRAPLEGPLAEYAGQERLVTEEVARRFLADRKFVLSWQIACEGETVARGRILPSDLRIWAMKDHALCQPDHFLSAQLRAGQRYTLTVEVEQADPAVNDLYPQLQVRTWGSLKGRPLVGWRMRDTLVFYAVGGVFLLMASIRWIYDGKPAPRTA
jgi:hypothetical protein